MSLSPPVATTLPFTVTTSDPDVVTITMQRSATDDAALSHSSAYTWMHGFLGSVTIDMSKLMTLNSMICSWIIALQQEVSGPRITLINCSPRVVGILRALHLNDLVDISCA